MHLCLSGCKLHLQVDPECLFQFCLVVDRLECGRVESGELAVVVDEAWFGEGNGNVVSQPVLHRAIFTGSGGALEVIATPTPSASSCSRRTFSKLRVPSTSSVWVRSGPIAYHQAQPAADHLLRQDLGLGGEGPEPKDDRDIAHVPPLTQHHHADNGLDLAPRLVDIARRLAGFFEVLLRDLASLIRMDDEHLGFFEAKLLCLPQVFAERIGVGVLFRHDEQDWLRPEWLVDVWSAPASAARRHESSSRTSRRHFPW